jgi:hypothetical protein
MRSNPKLRLLEPVRCDPGSFRLLSKERPAGFPADLSQRIFTRSWSTAPRLSNTEIVDLAPARRCSAAHAKPAPVLRSGA